MGQALPAMAAVRAASPAATARARVRISGLEQGAGFGRKLQDLGVHVGDVVTVMRNHGGTIIVASGNLRIAIGRGMGGRISVEPAASGT